MLLVVWIHLTRHCALTETALSFVSSCRRSASIYNFQCHHEIAPSIVRMTETWYAAVIARLPANARVLDVGIGTGSALARNAAAVVAKKLQWVGLDYDRVYVDACTINHATAGKPLGVCACAHFSCCGG